VSEKKEKGQEPTDRVSGEEASETTDGGWARASKWVKDYGVISGVVVLAISGLAYLCAYFYELGFCQEFGIPVDLIEISWPRFLAATIKLVYLILVFCVVCSAALPFYMKNLKDDVKN